MSKKSALFLFVTFSLFTLGGPLNTEAIVWTKRTWTLEHNPDAFAHDVAMACLTTKSSNISTSGNDITLQDDKACGDDLQTLSQTWDKNPDVQMASINTVLRDRKKMKAALTEKFKGSKHDELAVLPKIHCPCMVLQGSRAKEATAYIREQFGNAKQGITPLKFELHPSASPSP